ncbi:hypothetical protein AMTR_s00057p00202500 [Amborella trichopoda]|uniref:Uncharacterized protein n=1 Tax=Amborella trichopoda TaxID=13333 RepID=U5D6C6_AMBTC|nr:hypothetical protein AMTR_s00057p00202500 [Amborella trichopoda]
MLVFRGNCGIWRAKTKAVFKDPNMVSSVLFAIDIRSRLEPNLPDRFIGNAVITACASARVKDLEQRPFSFCVEVNKGVPSVFNGNFYVSAWWKFPFHELDFGYGRSVHGGPIVSGMDEFVLLLSNSVERGGINVWLVLEKEFIDRFIVHVYYVI